MQNLAMKLGLDRSSNSSKGVIRNPIASFNGLGIHAALEWTKYNQGCARSDESHMSFGRARVQSGIRRARAEESRLGRN